MQADDFGPVAETPDGVEIVVWAVPGAKRTKIVGIHDGALRIRVAQPAERGKANAALERLLSERLGKTVELVSGATSRRKRFRTAGLSPDAVRWKLGV